MKTTKTARNEEETMAWLNGTWRRERRIRTLGWTRLAKVYDAAQAGGKVQKLIEREARRCGYTPKTILTLNKN